MNHPVSVIYHIGKTVDDSEMTDTAHEIRRVNLRQLVDIYDGRDRLALKLGRERNQIDQLLAKKNMGPRLARDIEKRLGKERGWMDHPHMEFFAGEPQAPYLLSESVHDRERTQLLKIWMELSPDMRSHLLAIAKTLSKK